MAQTCTICRHKKRAEIEREMLEATPVRHIASLYRLSTAAIQRHRRSHLRDDLRAAHESAGLVRGRTLLAGITTAEEKSETLYAAALDILTRAQKSDPKLAIAAIKVAVPLLAESREFLRLRGEITGELSQAAEAPMRIQRAIVVMPRPQDIAHRKPLELAGPSRSVEELLAEPGNPPE